MNFDAHLEKINAIRLPRSFVFPNNKNIIMAAEQTVDRDGEKVVVVLEDRAAGRLCHAGL